MFFFSFSQQFSSLFASPNMQIKPLQRSVAFHIETSHLIFLAISYADNFNKSSEKLTNNKQITTILTLFTPMSHFYTPRKQKTKGFMTFSGGIEIGYWCEKGQPISAKCCISYRNSHLFCRNIFASLQLY